MSFKRYNGEKGKRIPITKGLYRSIKNIKPDVADVGAHIQRTDTLGAADLMGGKSGKAARPYSIYVTS